MSDDMSKDADLIQIGDEADVLLKDKTFNGVVNALVEETFQQFVNSSPEEDKKREHIYNKYRALVNVVHTLQQRVSVRDEIIANSDNNGE